MNPLKQLKTLTETLESRSIKDYKGKRGKMLYAASLIMHCAREMAHDRATMMAAALTYRTIFSLIPTIVLALLVFNAFGGFGDTREVIQKKIFQQLGIPSLELPTEAPKAHKPLADVMDDYWASQFGGYEAYAESDAPATQVATTAPEGTLALVPGAETMPSSQPARTAEENNHLRNSINGILDQLTGQVSKISFGSIGGIGFLVLVWGAMALIITVEQSFNKIYGCEQGRAWHIRIPLYWAVLTLGPVLLSVSLFLSGKLVDLMQTAGGLGPFIRLVSLIGAICASWAMLVILYTLLPNTKVAVKPAVIGALVAAVLFELGKAGFHIYVTKALPFFKFYGVLGLLPLFLLWIYITWLIILFGLELSYTLQSMRSGKFKHFAYRQGKEKYYDPRLLMSLMTQIAGAFKQGKDVTIHEMESNTRLAIDKILDLSSRLSQGKLIHQVEFNSDQMPVTYALSKPPESIKLADIMNLSLPLRVREEIDPDAPKATGQHERTLQWVEEIHKTTIGETTLADLLVKVQEPVAPTITKE
jgi:membrane protein